jgi:hypothetical protein
MPSFSLQPTPNPNSVKITADAQPFLEHGMATFASAEEAAGHALGERLFAIRGIANVFILPQFLTITKEPAADWDVLLPEVEAVLAAYLDARST